MSDITQHYTDEPVRQSLTEAAQLKGDLMVDIDRTLASILALRDFYDRCAKTIIQLRDAVRESR
jgi:hypothetical protein